MGKVKKANSEKSGKKKKQILPVPAAELQFGSLLSPATSAFTTDPTALAAADKALEVDAMARGN